MSERCEECQEKFDGMLSTLVEDVTSIRHLYQSGLIDEDGAMNALTVLREQMPALYPFPEEAEVEPEVSYLPPSM